MQISAMSNHPRVTEETPLRMNSSSDNAERGLIGSPDLSPGITTHATFQKDHLRTFSSNKLYLPTPVNLLPPSNSTVGMRRRSKSVESGQFLTVTAKQTKTRQRKNVGAFRRTRQDYATWKGRIGAYVEYDEYDLKKLISGIYQSLPTNWELVDCYDVVRLWLPIEEDHKDSLHFSGGEEDVPALPTGEGAYADGGGEIHASMPEVFVFGFGAVVFWRGAASS